MSFRTGVRTVTSRPGEDLALTRERGAVTAAVIQSPRDARARAGDLHGRARPAHLCHGSARADSRVGGRSGLCPTEQKRRSAAGKAADRNRPAAIEGARTSARAARRPFFFDEEPAQLAV